MTGRVSHLDAAGASRVSAGVLQAMVRHLELEQTVGGYEAEDRAASKISRAREAIGFLVGRLADDVTLTSGASAAFMAVLHATALLPGARVALLAGAYEANRRALELDVERRRIELVTLAVDRDHRLDLEDLDGHLVAGLDMVYVDHVASQRGVVQPLHDIAARCRAAGVPLVVDVAQSAGQLDLFDVGADAYVGTSRKWLRGPRGVGFVVVDPAGTLPVEASRRPAPDDEASISARVGLGVALDELARDGVRRRHARIAKVARRIRAQATDWGWQVGEPVDEPCGIVTLRHAAVEPADVHRHLRRAGIQVGVVPITRAADLDRPWLRVSAGADVVDAEVDDLLEALARW